MKLALKSPNIQFLKSLLKREYRHYQKFIILSTARSGSNYLVSLLNSHSQIHCFGEVINPTFVDLTYPGYDPKPGYSPEGLLEFRSRHPLRFINEIVFQKYDCTINAVGLKIFYHHTRIKILNVIWSYLINMPNLKILHLKRKNLLKCYLSDIIAQKTNVWKIYDPRHTTKDVRVELDPEECLSYFIRTRQDVDQFSSSLDSKDCLEIFYNGLVNDYVNETTRIQKFLNLEVQTLKSSLHKQNIRPLSQVISNYWDLKKRFETTPWREFFDD